MAKGHGGPPTAYRLLAVQFITWIYLIFPSIGSQEMRLA